MTLASCSRKPEPSVERLALPPFENLGEDVSLDWMGSAASEILASQLLVSAKIRTVRVVSRHEARAAGATRVLHGYFYVLGDRLRLRAELEDLEKGRIVERFNPEGRLADGILPLADAVARQVEPRARPFGTRNTQALKAYVEARASTDAGGTAAYERAVAADPAFGAAYVGWAESLLARGDRAGASRVLAVAVARSGAFGEVERAQLNLISATLRDDAEARVEALKALSRLAPADIDVMQAVGRAEAAAHRFAAAVEWHRRAARLAPDSPLVWNDLGYAEAFARNLEAARSALGEYRRLAPYAANPLDSLGDVHYYLGEFTEAEKFYREAHSRNPAFLAGGALYKAARARLMTGDLESAGKNFREFLEVRRATHDPLAAYRQAQWEHLTGRKAEAVARLKSAAEAAGIPEAASLGCSQLAAWLLEAGDRAQARLYAARALEAARSQGSRNLAILCRFLAEASGSLAELEALARRAFPEERRLQSAALGYALLFQGRFAEATEVLRELHRQTPPTAPEQVNVLLAWALVETGKQSEARELLEVYGLPQPGGEHPFAFLTFPRVLQLKSAVSGANFGDRLRNP